MIKSQPLATVADISSSLATYTELVIFILQPFPVVKMGFKVGMRLEGIDPHHPSLYCVLTIAEIKGFRLRLHFDGYSECFDFWANSDSPLIFPVGWAEKNGKVLQPPLGKLLL